MRRGRLLLLWGVLLEFRGVNEDIVIRSRQFFFKIGLGSDGGSGNGIGGGVAGGDGRSGV